MRFVALLHPRPHAYVHYACFIITETMSRTTLNHFGREGAVLSRLFKQGRVRIRTSVYIGDELVCKSDCVYIDGRC